MNNKDQLTEATINSLNEFYDMFDEDMEYEFVEKVTQKIQKVFPDAEVFEEPSSQGGIGSDYFTITLNGNEYTYEFDISEEEDMLYSDGVAKTANYYSQQIIADLKSKLNNKVSENFEVLQEDSRIEALVQDQTNKIVNKDMKLVDWPKTDDDWKSILRNPTQDQKHTAYKLYKDIHPLIIDLDDDSDDDVEDTEFAWRTDESKLIELEETRYCIKYFYNNKFIGYLNSYGDSRGHIWIRIYAGSDEKYIRKFNSERGAKISMNGSYAQNANELLVNSDENPIHLYSNSILENKEEGIDFNLLKSEIATLDDRNDFVDLSELKSIENKYNA